MARIADVIHHETIKLRAFVAALVADLEIGARARRVTLDALVFADELEADANLLRRVLTRLVGDALERAPAGTNVCLVVSPSGGRTEFRIADEGSIGVERRERVLGAADAGKLPGAASGLMFRRMAAEIPGGRISVAQTDGGTVVCLSVPCEVEAAPRESGVYARGGGRASITSDQTVLVVDDEPLIRASVRRALKETGYDVLEAGSAERALELLKDRQPISLLLSDVGLPGASGAELVRQARVLFPELPTLLMSARFKEALDSEGVLDGETYLLQKPFSAADLIAKLDELLRRPSSHATNCALASV